MSNRDEILKDAMIAVADREMDYGAPEECFETTAQIWNAILGRKTLKEQLSGADVAMMLIGLKLARLTASPDHRDSQVDIAGYAALMSEVV